MEKYSNEYFHEKDKEMYLQAFRRFPLTLTRGEGSMVWDADGNKYIDMLAGIAVNNVGHCHPEVVKAVREQVGTIMHTSNFFVNKPQFDLSKALIDLSGMDRVFLTNSGAESLEGAFKIARKYAHAHDRGGTIISFKNSFHGRTLATIASGKAKYQQGFDPIPKGFMQAPFNDIDALHALIDTQVAAIVIEPIQGEGGINVADKAFLKELRALCDKHNIVLIFDEVQCGMARTGYWFAKDYYGVEPDVMTLAKGLGAGMPIGAVLAIEKVASAIKPGDHGTTFGGNPVACASALASIEVIKKENLLEQAREKGRWLRDQVELMGDPSVKEIRGLGLMIGIEFDYETKPLVLEMLHQGVIANATADNVLRLVPPLNISQNDLGLALKVLSKSMCYSRCNRIYRI